MYKFGYKTRKLTMQFEDGISIRLALQAASQNTLILGFPTITFRTSDTLDYNHGL